VAVYLLATLALLWLTSCATVLHPDGLQTVAINSQPPGAAVTVNGTAQGKTPVQAQLDWRQAYTVELQKGGYDPYRQVLAKQVDPLFFLNILFIPGFVVDLATGAYQKFPDDVQGHLVPAQAARR